ncbi:MAG: YtxH domain-containing protein [Oscillatoriales cyanobacterium RM2_1_1]|nr:YtxH domain-containing protein [Oscillatoriales cyanobacterium SM2_3_0]NJO47905.1 YtxH domain-containing protein [Oscillatoriales cyanobacterium RM2_1_1]
MSNQRFGSFFTGLFLGSAVGTVLGLLIAPKNGKETRQLLKKSADALPELAEDLSTTLQMQVGRMSQSSNRNWDDTLGRLKEAIAAGLVASQQQYQVLVKTETESLGTPSNPEKPSVPD